MLSRKNYSFVGRVKKLIRPAINVYRHRTWNLRRTWGLGKLDKKLADRLQRNSGLFIEVGANDGLSQSNTAYLETYGNWSGILIEPLPRLFDQCVVNRPGCRHFNCACSSLEHVEENVVYISDRNLMSKIKRSEEAITGIDIPVACRTISSIIDECGDPHIDLLCVDVEGHELELLDGLDLSRHQPDFILIEVLVTPYRDIKNRLEPIYGQEEWLSPGDVLFRRLF